MSDKKTFPAGPRHLTIHVSRDMSKHAFISYWTDDGKRRRVSDGLNIPQTYKGRMAVAELKVQEIIREYVPTKEIETLAKEWVDGRKGFLRKKSYYGYQSKLRIFLRWKGSRPMSPETVKDYFAYRRNLVSAGTLHDDKIYLRRIFSSVSDVAFFDHIDLPKVRPETKQHYTKEQIGIIRTHLQEEDPQLWFACKCIFYLFLRPGSELRLLRVHHFDLSRRKVKVPANISKNNKLDYILIPPGFVQHIREFIGDKRPNEFMFPGVFDKESPIGANTMMKRYRRMMDELGFGPGYSMYSWKNTGAIDLVDNGAHPKKISLQMRHSSLEMTDRYLARMGVLDMRDHDLPFSNI